MISPAEVFAFESLVTPTEQGIASRVLAKTGGGSVTLFAFDAGQGLTEHTSPFEALVMVLEGSLALTIAGAPVRATPGTIVRMPANVPHALEASAVWRALSDQYDDDRNAFLLAEARQLDVQIAGRVHGFRWHLALENAFDRRIEVGRTPLVTLAPGRAVRVGLAWRR